MIKLDHIRVVYFIGIGGIGMSALARYCLLNGKEVYGYDRVATVLTEQLTAEGISISYKDAITEIPDAVLKNDAVLVVYTPAIAANNLILKHLFVSDYKLIKRSEFLGAVSRESLCLAVAGTHGKTTTSSILGHLLVHAEMPVTLFLGGIAENYHSNFVFRGNDITVVEADEYDRSFLQLSPDIACITAMDPDHLDIYGSAVAFNEAFEEFAALVPDPQRLIIRRGINLTGQTVGFEVQDHYSIQNIEIREGVYHFDFITPNGSVKDLRFFLAGHHNLMNAGMAMAMALMAGMPADKIKPALESFKGVERRFSYKIHCDKLVLIDDYAHHPEELKALFQAVDEMYPEDKKQIVFQPHLYSRTQFFAEGFAESLSKFDEVVLLDIYPAREEPIEGISSEWLLSQITSENKRVVSKEDLLKTMKASEARIKLMVGAGDIGAEVDRIVKKILDETVA